MHYLFRLSTYHVHVRGGPKVTLSSPARQPRRHEWAHLKGDVESFHLVKEFCKSDQQQQSCCIPKANRRLSHGPKVARRKPNCSGCAKRTNAFLIPKFSFAKGILQNGIVTAKVLHPEGEYRLF